jgi:hypothetical protein
MKFPHAGANHAIFPPKAPEHEKTSNPATNTGQRHPTMTTLNLPCGKDLNHLRIQLSDGLNLTAFLDHLATCEKCGQCQGKLIRELNGLIAGGG